jgi:hypothetical protein
MSERAAPERIWSGIDIFKVTAGTLAAVAAAVIGSFLGVAGTLIGAAVASVIGSIGTEVFAKSLNQGYARLRGVRPGEVAATPLTATTPADAPIPVHGDAATHAVPVTGAPHLTAAPGPVRPRWRRIVVAAGAFFVLAMGGIFAVEAVAGEPLAALVGSSDAKGNSFSPQENPDPEPSRSTSPEESTAPATDGPSSDPTVIPTIPPSTGENSQAPEPGTTQPEPTGTGSTGGSSGDGSAGNDSAGNGSAGEESNRDGSADLAPDATP